MLRRCGQLVKPVEQLQVVLLAARLTASAKQSVHVVVAVMAVVAATSETAQQGYFAVGEVEEAREAFEHLERADLYR